ncbi:hypothetical protein BLA29_013606, partial [Euroglyphus maynei]
MWCIVVNHRRRTYRSLVHGKTNRSGFDGRGPPILSRLTTRVATMRSRKSTESRKNHSNSKNLTKTSMVSHQTVIDAAGGGGGGSTISGGSTRATVRTGLDRGGGGSTDPNQLK